VLLGLPALLVLLRGGVRWAARARGPRGARWVEIAVPPKVDPGGARLLWATLGGIARPPLRRAV